MNFEESIKTVKISSESELSPVEEFLYAGFGQFNSMN